MELQPHISRSTLISWIVLPLVLVWLSTGYLIGVVHSPDWNTNTPASGQVLAETTSSGNPEVQLKPLDWNNQGLVTLWFDDAWASQFSVAYPLLLSKNITAALAVPTGMIGYPDYMSWNQIRLLQFKGWEITSHTRNHSCRPQDMTSEYIDSELSGALKDLNSQGLRATNFVTPCGVNSDIVTHIAQQYYLSLRTSTEGFNPLPVTNNYDLRVQAVERNVSVPQVQNWLDQAKKDHSWLILMFHQLDQKDNEQFGTSPQTFREIIDTVVASGLQIVTPNQALQLVVAPEATDTKKTVTIKNTPTGSLKVHEQANLTSKVVTRVDTGQVFPVLSTQPGWFQIDLTSLGFASGWISDKYSKEN